MTTLIKSRHFDAVIVGARCAGAATAMLLARRGARVLMVDRAPEGSDTLSTHALMRGAVMQLHNWGVLPAIIADATPPIRRTSFLYGDAPAIDIDLSDSHGTQALYAPRRTVLDRNLVRAAREAGAETLFGVAMTGLLRDRSGAVCGVELSGRGGQHRIECELVIGADGRDSPVAQMVGAGLIKRGTNASQVAYGYFSGLSNPGYRWYWSEGTAGGIIPTNDGKACVFFSAAQDGPVRIRDAVRTGGLAALIRERLPRMAQDLQNATLAESVRAFAGQVGHLREACGDGWALVGDAGYFKDPITAHGITDALRDAQLLADGWARGDLDSYAVTRDALSRDIFRLSDRIAAYDDTMEGLIGQHKALNIAMQANQQWIADHLNPRRVAA